MFYNFIAEWKSSYL